MKWSEVFAVFQYSRALKTAVVLTVLVLEPLTSLLEQ